MKRIPLVERMAKPKTVKITAAAFNKDDEVKNIILETKNFYMICKIVRVIEK